MSLVITPEAEPPPSRGRAGRSASSCRCRPGRRRRAAERRRDRVGWRSVASGTEQPPLGAACGAGPTASICGALRTPGCPRGSVRPATSRDHRLDCSRAASRPSDARDRVERHQLQGRRDHGLHVVVTRPAGPAAPASSPASRPSRRATTGTAPASTAGEQGARSQSREAEPEIAAAEQVGGVPHRVARRPRRARLGPPRPALRRAQRGVRRGASVPGDDGGGGLDLGHRAQPDRAGSPAAGPASGHAGSAGSTPGRLGVRRRPAAGRRPAAAPQVRGHPTHQNSL